MKPFYVAHIFYRPLGHAISLINQGYSPQDAKEITIRKFAYFGKKNNKRNKDFDQVQFSKHLDKFLNTPNAILCRKSKKHSQRYR